MGTVSSTMDSARTLASLGAIEGTTVIAARQTAGRGRSGRTWESPAGSGLYCSILLRPMISFAQFQPFSIAAGLALCDALDPEFRLGLRLKWPNDILAGGRKLAGLLITTALEGGVVTSAILGIGLNLQPDPARPERAISLADLGAGATDPFASMLQTLSARYSMLFTDQASNVLAGAEGRLAYVGEIVTIEDGSTIHTGVLRGLSATGALLLETATGQLTIHAGELTRGPRPV